MSKERDRIRRRSRSRSSLSSSLSRSRSRSRSRSLTRSRSRSKSSRSRRSRSKSSERKSFKSSNYKGSHSDRRVFRDTNSSDPRAIAARLFVGNLATDKVSREEVIDIFMKYGRVTAVSMLKGYAFIQYEKEEEARAAVAGENNTWVKGQKIDPKMAVEGRKKILMQKRDTRKSPPPQFRDRMNFDRGPPREQRGSYSDPYRRPPPDRGDPYRRDPYADPYRDPFSARDPYPPRDPLSRDPYPPRDPLARDPYPHRDPYAARDPYARDLPPRDPYARDPLSRDPYARDPPPRDPYARTAYPPVSRPPPSSKPVDCEITVVNVEQKDYASGVDLRLKGRSMLTAINILPSEDYLQRALDDVLRRGLPYNIVINAQNEIHRSITLKILHGTPQEHRNMPLDDALTLITRNFEDYDKSRREKSLDVGSAANPHFKLPDQEVSYLLNLLADNKFLQIDELNKVIRYLTERRDALIVKEGGVVPSRQSDPNGLLKDEAGLAKQQQELQSKILSVLGDQPNQQAVMTSALQAVTAYEEKAPPTSLETPPIDLNSPSVQQALNSLISSGGGILKNLGAVVASTTASAPAPTQASFGAPLAGSLPQPERYHSPPGFQY